MTLTSAENTRAFEFISVSYIDAVVDEYVVIYNLVDCIDFVRRFCSCIHIQVVQASILLVQLKEYFHKYGFDLTYNFLQEIQWYHLINACALNPCSLKDISIQHRKISSIGLFPWAVNKVLQGGKAIHYGNVINIR